MERLEDEKSKSSEDETITDEKSRVIDWRV